MCLLIYKPAGRAISEAHFRRGFQSNSHGGGFAWATGKNMWFQKPYWDVNEMWKAVQPYWKYPMIIHFRITTHGGHSADNTHPHDAGGGWVMGHNGIIPNMQCGKDESDTRAYIRTTIGPILKRHPEIALDPRFKAICSAQIGGSKLVFLRANGDHLIVNENLGDWEDGIWYSNRSYKEYRYVARSYSSHGSGHWYDGDYLPDAIPPYWNVKGITDNHKVRENRNKRSYDHTPSREELDELNRRREMQQHMSQLYGHDYTVDLEQERIDYENQLDAEFMEHTKSDGIVLPNFGSGECEVDNNATFFCYMCKKHFENTVCYQSPLDGTCWCGDCHKQVCEAV